MSQFTFYITENTESGAPLMTSYTSELGVYGSKASITVDYDDSYGEAKLNVTYHRKYIKWSPLNGRPFTCRRSTW